RALLLAVAGVVWLAGPVCGDEPVPSESTARYFRELRRRGLFKLAESYCLERLSHSGVSTAERTELTLELARTLAEHANFAGSAEQDELWARSDAALSELLKAEPDNPRRLLLEVQRALLPATVGHSRRLLAELEPYDAAAGKRAAASLHAAVQNLREAEARIVASQRKAPGGRAPSGAALRLFELRPLLGHVRLRL
ncbi:MAG: hypothetical protein HY290_18025, partial [Planctomycetia bacterium]|nr:hypothetical protein [Planctomycetia bacterium]